jgi:hypothetical protein
MDDIILIVGLGLSAILIWRYRAGGFLISIPLCWAILALALLLPGDGSWRDREFREDWPIMSGLLSLVWCAVFGSATLLLRWIQGKRRSRVL